MRLTEKIRYQVPILNLAARLDLAGESPACPFCGEPALTLIAAKNRFACGACERTGAQLDLARQVLRLDHDAAVAWLQAEYQLVDEAETDALLDSWRPRTKRPSLDDLFGGAAGAGEAGAAAPGVADSVIYDTIVERCPMVEPARSFLERRQYPPELVAELRLGWVSSPAELYEELERQHGRDRLRQAGLLARDGAFLLNHNRLLVPFVVSGRSEFLRARRIDGGRPEWISVERKRAPIFPHARLASLEPGAPVFLTPDVSDALAFLMKGLNGFALIGFESRGARALEPFLPYDVVLCGEPTEVGRRFNRALLSHFDALRKDARSDELPPGFGDWNEFRLFKRS